MRARDFVWILASAALFVGGLMTAGLAVAYKDADSIGRTFFVGMSTIPQAAVPALVDGVVIRVDVNRTAKGDYGVFKNAVAQESGAHCLEPSCVIE